MTFRRISARDSPKRVALRAARCEERLRLAVQLAARRAARSKAIVRTVLRSATVEGIPRGQKIKAGVVSFSARPLRGLHLLWPWHIVEQSTDSALAVWIGMTVRRRVSEKEGAAQR